MSTITHKTVTVTVKDLFEHACHAKGMHPEIEKTVQGLGYQKASEDRDDVIVAIQKRPDCYILCVSGYALNVKAAKIEERELLYTAEQTIEIEVSVITLTETLPFPAHGRCDPLLTVLSEPMPMVADKPCLSYYEVCISHPSNGSKTVITVHENGNIQVTGHFTVTTAEGDTYNECYRHIGYDDLQINKK